MCGLVVVIDNVEDRLCALEACYGIGHYRLTRVIPLVAQFVYVQVVFVD